MNDHATRWAQHVIASQGLSARVCAFTTTRDHGVSQRPYDSFNLGDHVGDEAAAVDENRQRLLSVIPQAPLWLTQVHGIDVFDADLDTPATLPPQADAAVTTQPRRVLAILTADCLPVVISAADGSVLGVAHAGWRGLANGVLIATLAAMRRRASTDLVLQAWIGPGIGATAFQVGAEVREQFLSLDSGLEAFFQVDPQDSAKWLADLSGLAAWQLRQHGVANVHCSALCTVTDPLSRFFSYRRDGLTGRMATVAWIQ